MKIFVNSINVRSFATIGLIGILGGFAVTLTSKGADDPAAPSGNAAHLSRLEETPEKPWRHLFSQNDIDLKVDETYALTFWARASQMISMRVLTKVSQPPWTGLQSESVEVAEEWQRYEVLLGGTGSVPGHTRIEFRYGGPEAADIWIADVSLRPAGADEASENLIVNGRFEESLNNWYIEGVQNGVFQVEVQSLADAAAGAAND